MPGQRAGPGSAGREPTVAARRLSRGAMLTTTASLVLITGFLAAVGLGLIPVALETVIANPRWRLFVEVCVLRVWPLWTATLIVAIAVYYHVRRASGSRCVLPRGTRRFVLYVNALVLLPSALAFEYFAGKAAGAFSPWYWQVVFIIFLGGIALLVMLLRHAARRELAKGGEAGPPQRFTS